MFPACEVVFYGSRLRDLGHVALRQPEEHIAAATDCDDAGRGAMGK